MPLSQSPSNPVPPSPFSSHTYSKSLPLRTLPLPQIKNLPDSRPSFDDAVSATYTGYPDYTIPFAYSNFASSSASSLSQSSSSATCPPSKLKCSSPTTIEAASKAASPCKGQKAALVTDHQTKSKATSREPFLPSLTSSTTGSVTSTEDQDSFDDDFSVLDYYGDLDGEMQEKVTGTGSKIIEEENWGGFAIPHDDPSIVIEPLTLGAKKEPLNVGKTGNVRRSVAPATTVDKHVEQKKERSLAAQRNLRDIEMRKAQRRREREESNDGRAVGACSENLMGNAFGGGMGIQGRKIEVTNPNFRFKSLEERGKGREARRSRGKQVGENKRERLEFLMKRWL